MTHFLDDSGSLLKWIKVNLDCLVPAQAKRMQPILVSCEALFMSNLQKNIGPVEIMLVQWGSWPSLVQSFIANCP